MPLLTDPAHEKGNTVISPTPNTKPGLRHYLIVYNFVGEIITGNEARTTSGDGNVPCTVPAGAMDFEQIRDLEEQVAAKSGFRNVVITNIIPLDPPRPA